MRLSVAKVRLSEREALFSIPDGRMYMFSLNRSYIERSHQGQTKDSVHVMRRQDGIAD